MNIKYVVTAGLAFALAAAGAASAGDAKPQPARKNPQASAAAPREALLRLAANLKKSPADRELREKIIRLSLTLDPLPQIPDAATEAEGAAEFAFKNAETKADYADAARQYETALLAAPWLISDYFNLGLAYEKAGLYPQAIDSYALYLVAEPEDAREVKKRIGGLKYAAKKQPAALDLAGSWDEFGRFSDPEVQAKGNSSFHHEFLLSGGYLVHNMVSDRATTEADRLGVPVPKGHTVEVWRLKVSENGRQFEGEDTFENRFSGEFPEDGVVKVTWHNAGNRQITYRRRP